MKKTVVLALSVVLLAALATLSNVRSARAVPQFRKDFVAKYVKGESSNSKDQAFAEAVNKARCNVCHVGTDKTIRNPFGRALAKLISMEDTGDRKKVFAAFDQVASEKVDPKNPKSPTFGERISAGKLPYDAAE